ncbi:MAG: fimbrillin family protein [Bacteroidales bacterium]|jgi:hypothetical protein|nr:fimbrillin family protein [Bacteroidales bacterium]
MNALKFIPVMAAIAMTACNSDDDAAGGRAEVKFSAGTAEIQTRVTDNSWAAGDPVGIYMIGAAGTLTSANIVEGADNRQYVAAAGTGPVSLAPQPGEAIYYPMSGNVEFIAYYPYRSPLTDFELPVSVANQGNQSAIDVLYAPKTNGGYSRNTAAPVDLRFEHRLVKLTFDITQGDGVTGPTGSLASMTVNITGQQTAATLDLNNGTIAVATGGPKNITAYETENKTSSAKYEAIVLPNSSVSGMMFTFATKYMGTFEVAVPTPGGGWLSGYRYDYTIILNKNEVEITGTAGEWGPGSAHNVTGVPQPPLEGYAGNIDVAYTDAPTVTIAADEINRQSSGKTVRSITLADHPGKTYLIGRTVHAGSLISLKFNGSGDLLFRDASADGYIPIGSYAEFQMIYGNGTDKKYRQEADLNLMNEEWTPIANNGEYFNGEFDGAGKKISNLKINQSNSDRGLFRRNRGMIRDVHIASGTITATTYGGGICGRNESTGKVISCSNAANVSGTSYSISGIAGQNDGDVTDCYNTGAVSGGGGDVGGIVGFNIGTITACYNAGTVSGNDHAGGVAGRVYSGGITACYNTGVVKGTNNVGGVTGSNSGAVTACYNAGEVSRSSGSSSNFGSVAGYNSSTVTACYWKSGTVTNNTNNNGIGTEFDPYFTPTGSDAWGTGTGGTNGYWKAGTTNGSQLPKLWYE